MTTWCWRPPATDRWALQPDGNRKSRKAGGGCARLVALPCACGRLSISLQNPKQLQKLKDVENNVTWWSVPSSIFRQNERIIVASTMHPPVGPHEVGCSLAYAHFAHADHVYGKHLEDHSGILFFFVRFFQLFPLCNVHDVAVREEIIIAFDLADLS